LYGKQGKGVKDRYQANGQKNPQKDLVGEGKLASPAEFKF